MLLGSLLSLERKSNTPRRRAAGMTTQDAAQEQLRLEPVRVERVKLACPA
jgi:hypothetical protein